MHLSGKNRVGKPVKTLGLDSTFNGFHLNTNLEIKMEEGDNLNDYAVERDAFVNGEFRDFGKEDPGDPHQIARADHSLFVFDGPGPDLSTQQAAGMMTPGVAMRRDNLGSGTFGAIFEVRVVNKKENAYDPKRHFYYLEFTYKNGRTVGDPKYVELTEARYRELLAKYSEEEIKRKEKPHL